MKYVRRFAAVPVVLIAVLLGFRSIWALSLFHGLGSEMSHAGWNPVDNTFIMQPKEVVTFEASYFIFKLGTVRFELLGKTVWQGKPAYWIRAFIDSYSGIPFVDFHGVYETCADARTLVCLHTSNDQEDGDNWVHTSYDLNYGEKMLVWEQSVKGVVTRRVDIPLDTVYTDGLSFFYYVREACRASDGKREILTVPMVSDTNLSSVRLTINEALEPCEVSAFDFPIQAERMSGYINFRGTFGVTGYFNGWISADSAEVPLRADLKVIVGSIAVKLKDIKRQGWLPPKAE